MNKFAKSILALGITSALSISPVYAASYDIIKRGEVTDASTHKYTYAQKENINEVMALSGTSVFNFPVQFQYLDDDDFTSIDNYAFQNYSRVFELVDLEDLDALKAGTPTANDMAWTIRWLQAQGNNTKYQKVGGTSAMTSTGTDNQEFTVFDTPLNDAPLSRSTLDVIKGITDDAWVYGNASAAYLPLPPVDVNGEQIVHWYREFSNRAFFSPNAGQDVFGIIPPSENITNYGGESGVLDLVNVDSNTHFAVGFMSTKMNSDVLDRILSETDSTGCANPNYIDEIPQEICIQSLRDSPSTKAYEIRAFKSVISGDITTPTVETVDLGLLVQPHADDTRTFASYGQAINTDGVVVGFSHGWVNEEQTNPSSNEYRDLFATVWKDDGNGGYNAYSLTEDHNVERDSRAYDINNAGIAVGHVNKAINGNLRTKFYYIDTTNIDTMVMEQPQDFFTGSSSTARAINNNNLIVGEGEFETHNDSNGSNPRRTHAFLYDMDKEIFSDVNDLIDCSLKQTFSIIEARDINDNNVISATAVVKVDRRDTFGNVMKDAEGNPLREDVVMAVTLKPKPEDGVVCTAEEEEKVVRQGASVGMWSIFVMSLLGIRRRFFKK